MNSSRIPVLSGRPPFWAQLGEFALAGFSALILFSFGGQVIVAPALLPIQWLVARHTAGWVSRTFSVLGALLTTEVIWLGWALVAGDGVVALIGGIVVAVGAGVVFYRISRPGS
jgi:hypothetical protein